MKPIKKLKRRLSAHLKGTSIKNFRSHGLGDFFCPGCIKGGTKALDEFLRSHPEVQMPVRKELSFFEARFYPIVAPFARRFYNLYFSSAKEELLRGEVTPSYLLCEEAFERIHAYNPSAKFILLLRDPASRAYSHWNMRRQDGSTSDFTDIVEKYGDGRKGEMNRGELRIIEGGLYGQQVKGLLSIFPRDQVLILKSENLKKETNSCLEKIAGFLGLAPFDEPEETEYHTRAYQSSMSDELNQKLQQIYQADLEILQEFVDWDCLDWKGKKKAGQS